MENTFFSILIPTHHRSKVLERSISSVLNQTYTKNQFIVVSDVEDLDTYNLVSQSIRDNDIFIQRNGLQGPAESRNIALQMAKGSHVIFLDDDDALHPSFLEDIAKEKIIHNNEKIIYVNCEVIDQLKFENIQKIDLGQLNFNDLYVKNYIPNNCVIYPSEIARKIKFNDAIAYEDWHYLLNALAYGDLVHIPIYGPIIYKNSDLNLVARGEINNNAIKLINCYRDIYLNFPVSNPDTLSKRKNLFQSVGLDYDEIMKDHHE